MLLARSVSDPIVRVLDCTLRDGGNYTGWRFSRELVRGLVGALDAAGVNIIELGYRSPPSAPPVGAFGVCDEAFLRDTLPEVSAELAFMIDTKAFVSTGRQIDVAALAAVVAPASESVFSWCRIATHTDMIAETVAMSAWIRRRGFRVAINVMGVSTMEPAALDRVLGCIGESEVDALFLADSFGALTPEQTVALVRAARARHRGSLGVHLHDNMGLALANALAAIDHGADLVDSSLGGMGRGAGNLRTEQLLLALRHARGRTDLDPQPLWSVLERHMQPLQRTHGWGWSPAYMAAALGGIHPSYCQTLSAESGHGQDAIVEMLQDLPGAERARFDDRALEAARERHADRRRATTANRAAVIIPARHRSSRFPGKPLVPILGVPMVVRVARLAATTVGQDRVYVATDDDTIARVVRAHGFAAVMTSPENLTGTDRVAEVAAAIEADVYLNVQADEPMLDPQTIRSVLDAKLRAGPGVVVNALARVGADEDVASVNLPKVVVTESGRLVYMSRSAVPGFKDHRDAPARYWKQVCVYAFDRETLAAFASLERKSTIERSEDIEILRFLDLGVPVQMVEVPAGSLAVDVPDDVGRVEAAMRARGLE